MGSCDWNDGMSNVGDNGGESVWLGMFSRMIIHGFLHVIGTKNEKLKEELEWFSHQINMATENTAFNGKWYARAYYASGKSLGNDPTCKETACAIDLLPQAFSAFCYCILPDRDETKKERVLSALKSAYRHLFDEKNNLIRLFTPPFSNEQPSPGYISGYVKGFRENGGQYTHAAIWLARAFLMMGQTCQDQALTEKGKRLVQAILPIRYAANKELAERYGGEPYVLAGDVYANDNYYGKCGWSWYTGSAGWLYRTLRDFDLTSLDFI
jgi:cyclic beta-1,2-glucan synthetase